MSRCDFFFGGSPPGRSTEKAKAKDTKPKRGRKVVHDEEDEDAEDVKPKRATPKRATPKKKQQPEPMLEETTASDYFGNGDRAGKVKRSDAGRPKTRGKPSADETPKAQANGGNVGASNKSTGRKKKDVSYVELDAEDFPDDNMLDDEVVENFKSEAMVGRRMGDDYAAGTDVDDDQPLLPKRTARSGKQTKLKDHEQDDFEPDDDVDMKDTNEDDDFVVPDDDEEIIANKPGKKMPASKKRKSVALEDDDEDLEMEETKPAKKEAPQDSAEVKAIFDSIPTIQAPEPPPKDGEKPKFQFGQHPSSTVPAAAVDMNELPQGEENCLAGLSFVFTGQLERLGREQGQTLVKQYGGRCTGVPSKKTSFVVLGEDAGPKKLETIKAFNLKVINEDGLFALIQKLPANGGDSVAAEKMAEKREKDESNIRKAAAEMEKQEKDTLAAQKAKTAG
ncbi:DNA replication factor C complex subunit Rfc1 [Friedmanniomyces endolithicus]|nr:DNA replication factor C complex subunit Rfc1 [Friedmanniomyces endolithicus]